MSGGYSGKFSQSECKIKLSRDNLREQKVLEGAFFRLSKSLKSKILATRVPLQLILGLLQTPRLSYSEIEMHAGFWSFSDPFLLLHCLNWFKRKNFPFPFGFLPWNISIFKSF